MIKECCDFRINYSRLGLLARLFRNVLTKFRFDTFTDERFYPPPSTGREETLRYFIFMVAIDHRTSRCGPFEGFVDGEFYHGADLLYRLGMKRFMEDPEFFSPEKMSVITPSEVADWLRPERGDAVIWDPEVRASLLRDLGVRLLKLYGGQVSELVRASGGLLKSPNGLGLIDRLKGFKAYSDPVEKKAYLFVKFASRRGLIHYSDKHNSEVPVDNHLVRIALRLHLVEPRKELLHKILEMKPFMWGEDVGLRLAVRDAYKFLSRLAGIDPLMLDDFLWLFGRHCCTYSNPACITGCSEKCRDFSICTDKCPFREYCVDARPEAIKEHNYRDTYYY
ncbi:MAG: hypothetical protein J7L55_03195 [Desulfurococcales archaeon]|nr:hypothetical protein [Desulfurococcales archaeon]